MKKLLLVLLFCLFATNVFAGVTAEILAYDLDDNGNIRVKTQYKIDGVEVVSRYPQLGGKYYFVTRYHALNFAGMSDAEIKARILEDVENHAENLIKNTYMKKKNINIHDNHIKALVGSKVTETTTTVSVDTDGDNVNDEIWTIKSDGSHTSAAIITP